MGSDSAVDLRRVRNRDSGRGNSRVSRMCDVSGSVRNSTSHGVRTTRSPERNRGQSHSDVHSRGQGNNGVSVTSNSTVHSGSAGRSASSRNPVSDRTGRVNPRVRTRVEGRDTDSTRRSVSGHLSDGHVAVHSDSLNLSTSSSDVDDLGGLDACGHNARGLSDGDVVTNRSGLGDISRDSGGRDSNRNSRGRVDRKMTSSSGGQTSDGNGGVFTAVGVSLATDQVGLHTLVTIVGTLDGSVILHAAILN